MFQKKNFFYSLEGRAILVKKSGAAFIVFEGLDGSGLSTQAKLLRDFLDKKGYELVLTKEPALNFKWGKKIQEILAKKDYPPSGLRTQSIYPKKEFHKKLQELFAENRKEHLKKVIIPALKERKIVISDRYFFSSFTYGSASGLDLDYLIGLNKKFLLPDITFILKVRPEICLVRIRKRKKAKTLFEEKEKLEKVWQIYQLLPERFENVYMIDGERPIKEVFEEVKLSVLSKLIT